MIRGTIVEVSYPGGVLVWVDAVRQDDGTVRAVYVYFDGWLKPTSEQIADAISRVESGEIPIPIVTPAPCTAVVEMNGWGWPAYLDD